MKPVIPLAGLAAGVGLAVIAGVTQAAVGPAWVKGQIPAAVIPKLTRVAYDWAASEGDRSPESVLAIRTTRAKALHIADRADTIPNSSHTLVYLVVENGHFHPTGFLAVRLPGTRTPVPNLELILSVASLTVLDMGVGRGSKYRPTVTLNMLEKVAPVSRLIAPASSS